MPQGLVPAIISQLRLTTTVHKGTKVCPYYSHTSIWRTRATVSLWLYASVYYIYGLIANIYYDYGCIDIVNLRIKYESNY